MSTTAASAYLADLQRRLAPYGVDGEAAAWLLKCLHPALPASSPGIPDHSYVHSVRPEFRSQTIIGAPPGLATPTWDLLIWRRPTEGSPVRWCAAPGGTNFRVNGLPAGATAGEVTLIDHLPGLPSAMSHVTPGNDTAFPISTIVPADDAYVWRTQYASLTAYLTASALNDQGTVFAVQQQRDVMPDLGTLAFNGSYDPPLIVRRARTSVPFEENEMLLMDPKAYTAPAREGVYLPLRLSGPSQLFVRPSVDDTGLMKVQDSIVGFPSSQPGFGTTRRAPLMGTIVSNYDQQYVSQYYPFTDTTLNSYEFSWDNVHQAVIIFRGLAPAASVTLKHYVGLEQQPGVDAPTRQFARVPNMYVPRAMEAYYRLVHELPSAYPSSFNALGTILGAISSVAQRLWPVVQRVVPAIGAGVRAAVADYERRGQAGTDLSARQSVVVPRAIEAPAMPTVAQRPKELPPVKGRRRKRAVVVSRSVSRGRSRSRG